MIVTWLELAKKYPIFDERFPEKKSRVSIEGITRMVERDEDYFLVLRSRLNGAEGEIYRYSNDGSVWGIYIKGAPSGYRIRKYWDRFKKWEFEMTQRGEIEAAWKFGAEYLPRVIKMLGVKGYKAIVQSPTFIENRKKSYFKRSEKEVVNEQN